MRSYLGLFCGVLLLVGCHKDIQNADAVRQGILNYLSKRPDLMSMDVNVSSVAFRKDEADATVYFQAKGGPAGNGMTMNYVLERKGDQWVVKGRGSAAGAEHGANPHGGAVPGMVPTPEPALPPGHPPINPSTPPSPR